MTKTTKRIQSTICVGLLLVCLFVPIVGLFVSGLIEAHASEAMTTTIAIEKQWVGDAPADRPDSFTAYIGRDSSTTISGSELNAKMKQLSGDGSSEGDYNYTIYTIKQATEAQFLAEEPNLTSANEIQASGKKSYMWFEDSTNTIYLYSEAGKVFAPADFGDFARRLVKLSDISGLAMFDTTYTTTIDRMFQDASSLSDLSPIAGWNTTNVTDMAFTFGGNTSKNSEGVMVCEQNGHNTEMNITDLSPISGWDVRNVTSMWQTFKCNTSLDSTSLSSISGWDVKNVTDMELMFNFTAISTIDPIKDWDVSRVTNFSDMMLNNTALSPLTQSFTVRSPGEFNASGSYVTSTTADPNPDPVAGKVDTGDEQSCNSWVKDDVNNVWTCTFTVSNDGADYVAWEGNVPGYLGSATVTSPVNVVNGQAVISNTLDTNADYFINLTKVVSGDAADTTRSFDFNVTAYDENGDEILSHRETLSLKDGESGMLFALPQGYSYSVSEMATDYSASYVITNTDDSTQISAAANASTGRITPNENQTVTFTNTKTNDSTKVLTITKEWEDDLPSIRPQASGVTVKVQKTVSYLPDGATLKATIESLAGSRNNVKAIKKVDAADCANTKPSTATTISTSGGDTFMWWNSGEGAIYICSVADNVYANANMQQAFNVFANLTDISGLALLNTTYVTNMAGMFTDSVKIESLAPLENWDTGNVTSMRYMFGANVSGTSPASAFMSIKSVAPLANWNTQSVTDTGLMFKGCIQVTDASSLNNWNLQNLLNANQMFFRTGLTDATSLGNWRLERVGQSYTNVLTGASATGSFSQMFGNLNNSTTSTSILPKYNGTPGFQGRSGTWGTSGTLTPSSGPTSGSVPVSNKVDNTPNLQTCTNSGSTDGTWNTSNDALGKWTCTLTVSNDGAKYTVWEEPISYYNTSATQANPTTIASDTATVTNTRQTYTITVRKYIVGNLADINKSFDLSAEVYDGNTKISDYDAAFALGEADEGTFRVPAPFAYQITETNDGYTANYKIEKTADGTVVQAQTVGVTTNKVTPTYDQTVTFINEKKETPLTGIGDNDGPFKVMIGLVVVGALVGVFAYFSNRYIVSKARDG